MVYRVIGAQCQPIAEAEGLGGSMCNVHAMSSAALRLPFAPVRAAFPLVLANDASLMLHGRAGRAEEGNVSGDRGATWVKIKTQ